jgi:ubiquitin carboxyl-terminal hydrolase 22/27/51
MATAVKLPRYGCEHFDDKIVAKVRGLRSKGPDSSSVQYTCLECPVAGSFDALDTHFQKTKHEFAASSKSVFCGQCKDLVYDPDLVFNGAKKRRKLAQPETNEEDEAYLAANTTARPCGREGVRGLFNLGETCYMNAVLQMMVHNPLLASYFLGMGHPVHLCPISNQPDKKNDSDSEDDDDNEDKEQKTCVACGMTEVFSDATQADQSLPAHAVNLLFASWKNIPHMSGKQQQDAQEWFILIVDKLHEAVSQHQNSKKQCDCFFHKVFFGRLNSEVTCDKCHTTSTTEDEYSSISLDFKKQAKKKKKASSDVKTAVPNVHECLRSYTAAESLTSEQYKCRSCDAPRSASKRVSVRKLPAILCIHVKRFGMKIAGTSFVQEKYEGKIDFPLVLDMAPYTKHPDTAAAGDQFVYDLECVVVHQGENVHNGHYFAFCRQDKKWFRFDDEIVSATTTEDVLRQEAYLCFYSLRSLGVAS